MRVLSAQFLVDCRLRLVSRGWGFAVDHAAAIDRHWSAAVRDNPKIFDGDVFVTERWRFESDTLYGDAVPTKFSAYLYWRDHGFDKGCTSETFATTVVVAADGGVLLARAAEGSLNEGFYVSPGGLVDQRDVHGDGFLDLAGAALRELAEETGLEGAGLSRQAGFLLADLPPYFGVASVFRAAASGPELLVQVADYLARQREPELVDPRLIYRSADMDELPVTEFARLLTQAILA